MTIDDIQKRLKKIRAHVEIRHDDEVAHRDTDHLYRDVLHAIAAGAENPAALAQRALEAEAIEFSRWYA
jgi:hypothetical protein